MNKLGLYNERIYARNCEIKEIDNKFKDGFLEGNHLQSKCQSTINLGLFHNDELVSVMTFGKRKISGNKSQFELLRFCNKLHTQILGGSSKLFKYFLGNYNCSNILTYANRRFSNGDLYYKLGFEFSHESRPNYFYVNFNDSIYRYSRLDYQKHKLRDKFDYFDPNLTE